MVHSPSTKTLAQHVHCIRRKKIPITAAMPSTSPPKEDFRMTDLLKTQQKEHHFSLWFACLLYLIPDMQTMHCVAQLFIRLQLTLS